jgi:hypothetical protein
MKTYGAASGPGRFTPVERAPGTHWIKGWVNPRAGLDDVENKKFLTLPGLELIIIIIIIIIIITIIITIIQDSEGGEYLGTHHTNSLQPQFLT